MPEQTPILFRPTSDTLNLLKKDTRVEQIRPTIISYLHAIKELLAATAHGEDFILRLSESGEIQISQDGKNWKIPEWGKTTIKDLKLNEESHQRIVEYYEQTLVSRQNESPYTQESARLEKPKNAEAEIHELKQILGSIFNDTNLISRPFIENEPLYFEYDITTAKKLFEKVKLLNYKYNFEKKQEDKEPDFENIYMFEIFDKRALNQLNDIFKSNPTLKKLVDQNLAKGGKIMDITIDVEQTKVYLYFRFK